jgi:hypothetical protein
MQTPISEYRGQATLSHKFYTPPTGQKRSGTQSQAQPEAILGGIRVKPGPGLVPVEDTSALDPPPWWQEKKVGGLLNYLAVGGGNAHMPTTPNGQGQVWRSMETVFLPERCLSCGR